MYYVHYTHTGAMHLASTVAITHVCQLRIWCTHGLRACCLYYQNRSTWQPQRPGLAVGRPTFVISPQEYTKNSLRKLEIFLGGMHLRPSYVHFNCILEPPFQNSRSATDGASYTYMTRNKSMIRSTSVSIVNTNGIRSSSVAKYCVVCFFSVSIILLHT